MPSPIASATIQAAILSAISNILAQTIAAYKDNKPFVLDLRPIIQFTLYALISTPPNYVWQETLEEWFPGNPEPKKESEKKVKAVKPGTKPPLSIANTVKKFLVDQTVGAPLNTLMFLLCMKGIASGGAFTNVVDELKRDFLPLHVASLKLWPAVGLISLTFVPVDKRILFGATVSLFWNIYLGLVLR